MKPTLGQMILLALSAALFGTGGLLSLARVWRESNRLRVAGKACMYSGLLAAIGLIVWHSLRRGYWHPMGDNFDALVWLAVLLSLFIMYIQRVRPVGGLDLFLVPVVVLLLVAAGVFGQSNAQEYSRVGQRSWLWVHTATAYLGAVAFAVAAAVGLMYVIASRRLRRKAIGPPAPGGRFTNLERLERMMMWGVTLGFALLTVGLVTGFGRVLEYHERTPTVKVLLATLAWFVYAIVMHAPINPRFRGRRAAILSVLGFLLMIGTLIVVQGMKTAA